MADHLDRLRAALADRYAIKQEIGAGGMATVYLAEDLKHDRKVAVKVLRPELAAVLGGQRFLNEIKVTANLQHPHILPLHDSGEADSLLYYVMPYVEGESLREKLNRQGRLSIDEALRISSEVADALTSAHRQAVVHRDIKPENILLREGHALVTDFGIALAVTEAGGQRLTETGLSLGTPAYMSPEQVAGDCEIDGRSDIYSLACVLYEMLAGDPPFLASSSQAVLARHVIDPAPPITTVRPDVPRPVAAALATALSKTPADRFECATALKEALFSESAAPESQTKSIVVLPFENLSPDPDQDYFSDGLTEEIISDLSNVRALRVISRSSAMTYKGSNKRIPEIARELNVRYVLEGSVRKGGDNLRVTAQLIDSHDDTHLWAEKYTGSIGDVFEMQESVSRRIMGALQVALTGDEDRRLATRALPDLRAFDRCLRARQALYSMTERGLDLALELIGEALEITGPNALLYATLAEAYYAQQEGMVRLGEKPLELGASWVAKSLALDPDNPVALRSRGLISYKRGDIEGALRDLRRSSELQADGVSYGWLGWFCGMVGEMNTARQYTDQAVSLDPMFRIGCLLPGWLALLEGDFDTALEQARLVVELSKDDPWAVFWLGIFAFTAQHGDEARETLMQIIAADEIPPLWRTTCSLMHALTRGDAEAVRRGLSSTEFIEVAKVDWTLSWLLADVFAQLGESDRALHWLENTLELGFMNRQFFSRVDPLLEPLRSEAGFHTVMDHMSEKQRRVGRVDPVRAVVEAREI